MRRTILIPVDGSPLSEEALVGAHALFGDTDARIVLTRVVPWPYLSGDAPELAVARAVAEARAYLAEFPARFPRVPVDQTIVVEGPPAEKIGEVARQVGADLIVMATHGRSGLGRAVFGSVADAVVRTSPIPVLLVPAGATPASPRDRSPLILVPLDGSPLSARALGPAGELAAALDASLCLLRVVETPPVAYADFATYVPYDPTPELEVAQRYLDDVAAELRVRGLRVTVCTSLGAAVAAIGEAARALAADLVAMSTHGSGGLRRLLVGSVTAGVVRQRIAPVLVVNAGTPGALDASAAAGTSGGTLARKA
jgi:nucleotide-binding universal stress UspA family protein